MGAAPCPCWVIRATKNWRIHLKYLATAMDKPSAIVVISAQKGRRETGHDKRIKTGIDHHQPAMAHP